MDMYAINLCSNITSKQLFSSKSSLIRLGQIVVCREWKHELVHVYIYVYLKFTQMWAT